ncbi:MAG: hypothetical protein ABR599_03990 [Gemmatimonadota bacterium]
MLSREPARLGSVYWMEASKRRQALEWLARDDLTAEERRELEVFAARWRTGTDLDGLERRRLLGVFERLERRLRAAPSAKARRPDTGV